jgi:uncharacterized damage-inducible protein DinB
MKSMTEKSLAAQVGLLLTVLDQSFENKAWHGPNLRGSIRGVSPQEAAWRPAPKRHNIWEIVLHTAYWKYAVRRMLTGERRGSFSRKGSNWFPCPSPLSASDWREAVTLLTHEHAQLRAAIQDLRPMSLYQRPASSKYTRANLLYGIASHDVYHAGQIQLLKRLYPGKG